MNGARDRCHGALKSLVAGGRFQGASLVRRDGLPVLGVYSKSVSDETFSAMTAAMLGASEAAFDEWGAPPPTLAILHGGELRMALMGLDADTLLVLVAGSNGDLGAFMDGVAAAQAEVATAMEEA